jgi:hypothetical protein
MSILEFQVHMHKFETRSGSGFQKLVDLAVLTSNRFFSDLMKINNLFVA